MAAARSEIPQNVVLDPGIDRHDAEFSRFIPIIGFRAGNFLNKIPALEAWRRLGFLHETFFVEILR